MNECQATISVSQRPTPFYCLFMEPDARSAVHRPFNFIPSRGAWRCLPNLKKRWKTCFTTLCGTSFTLNGRSSKRSPKWQERQSSDDLKAGFEKHREETEGHVDRLEQIFELLGKRAQGKTCPGIEGILEEGEEIMDEFKGTVALDAGLISAAQAVEHYEITRYGTLKRWAEELGMADAVELLDQTLQEEAAADEALTALADASANDRAKQAA